MAITNLITAAEADVYNALSADWLLLTDTVKDNHIYTATAYMQARWLCTDVDWDDDTTIDDDILRACAYYADADSQGLLYPSADTIESQRSLSRETKKLGSMEKTLEWSGGHRMAYPLAPIDAIMRLYCIKTGVGSGVITRV